MPISSIATHVTQLTYVTGVTHLAILPFGNSCEQDLKLCPEGTADNSPAFQRRERGPNSTSPEGAADRNPRSAAVQRSLRDMAVFVTPPSVETLGYFHKSLRDIPPGRFCGVQRSARPTTSAKKYGSPSLAPSPKASPLLLCASVSFHFVIERTQPLAQFVYPIAVAARRGIQRNVEQLGDLLEGQPFPELQVRHRPLIRRQFA